MNFKFNHKIFQAFVLFSILLCLVISSSYFTSGKFFFGFGYAIVMIINVFTFSKTTK